MVAMQSLEAHLLNNNLCCASRMTYKHHLLEHDQDDVKNQNLIPPNITQDSPLCDSDLNLANNNTKNAIFSYNYKDDHCHTALTETLCYFNPMFMNMNAQKSAQVEEIYKKNGVQKPQCREAAKGEHQIKVVHLDHPPVGVKSNCKCPQKISNKDLDRIKNGERVQGSTRELHRRFSEKVRRLEAQKAEGRRKMFMSQVELDSSGVTRNKLIKQDLKRLPERPRPPVASRVKVGQSCVMKPCKSEMELGPSRHRFDRGSHSDQDLQATCSREARKLVKSESVCETNVSSNRKIAQNGPIHGTPMVVPKATVVHAGKNGYQTQAISRPSPRPETELTLLIQTLRYHYLFKIYVPLCRLLQNRRNDREAIRQKLAMGGGEEEYYGGERMTKKPNLQTRLQSGMNLQLCYVNDVAAESEHATTADKPTNHVPNQVCL